MQHSEDFSTSCAATGGMGGRERQGSVILYALLPGGCTTLQAVQELSKWVNNSDFFMFLIFHLTKVSEGEGDGSCKSKMQD